MKKLKDERMENRLNLLKYIIISFIISCIFSLITNNKSDRILFIISGFFQLISISSIISNSYILAELMHGLLISIIVIAIFYYNTKYSNIYIIFILLIILFTRIIYDKCLFYNNMNEANRGLFSFVEEPNTILFLFITIELYKLVNIIK
tara:strand:+ start:1679 stop:2125 length:447 start_codon:yes stop_codon:yes gene_type:complete